MLVPTRIAELDLSPALTTELAPLFAVYASLNEQIATADRRIATLAATDPIVARLATAPGVGPVTASAFVATIDDITRFRSALQLEAYLGVVPSERSSGEKRQLGRITKAGNGRMRWLLVEAAWRILRSKSPATAALRVDADDRANDGANGIAAVALARPAGGDSVRDVARRHAVRRTADSAAGTARNHSCCRPTRRISGQGPVHESR